MRGLYFAAYMCAWSTLSDRTRSGILAVKKAGKDVCLRGALRTSSIVLQPDPRLHQFSANGT